MKTSTSLKIKTGAFVVAGFVALVVLIFLIGKQKNLFGNTFLVYASFKNISGLKEGNYIRFAGINVGTVNDISIVNDTTIRVGLSLQNKIKSYIKTDNIVTIGSDGLMGDKLVQIGPGTADAPLLKEGGQMQSVNPADMDKMMAKFGKIADNAESLTGSLAGVVEKINSGQGSLGRLVNSDKLALQLESTVASTKQTVNTMNKTAASVNDNMEAAKHSFLLRGYFKKKEKKRVEDSTSKANANLKDTTAVKKKQ